MKRLILLSLALTGCAGTDPYERAAMWQPEGVNSANLAAMLDRPADLIRGRGDRGPTRLEAQAAVARVWEGRERPLPIVNTSAETTPAPPAGQPPPTPAAGH